MDKIQKLSEDIYNKLYPVYDEMIGVDLDDSATVKFSLDSVNSLTDNWLQAETRLKECLEFLEKIWIKDREVR